MGGKYRNKQMITYYRYLNTRTNCFCSPPEEIKQFASNSNTSNISNYVRVSNALTSGNSFKGARVQFGGNDTQITQIQYSNTGKQFFKK